MSRVLTFALVFFSAALATADDYQGATEALQTVARRVESKEATAEPQGTVASVAAAIEAFGEAKGTLTADEAAQRWLDLYDHLSKLLRSEDSYEAGELVGTWLAELPQPETWPTIAKQIEARPVPEKGRDAIAAHGLRLLAHTLVANEASRQDDVKALEKLVNAPAGGALDSIAATFGYSTRSESRWLREAVKELSPQEKKTGADAELALFEEQLATGKAAVVPGSVYVPDLVKLVGPDQAEKLLRQALKKNNFQLIFEEETETAALARKLALSMVEELKTPPWLLANSVDAVPLYEALVKRFGAPDPYHRGHAFTRGYYAVGLLKAGRPDDAKTAIRALLKQSDEEGHDEERTNFVAPDRVQLPVEEISDDRKLAEALWQVLHELLLEDSSTPVWAPYASLSIRLQKQEQLAALIAKHTDGAGFSPQQIEIQRHLVTVLLAESQVEKAVAIMSDDLLAPLQELATDGSEDQALVDMALQLAELGRLMKRDEWLDLGLQTALGDVAKPIATDDYRRLVNLTEVVDLLVRVRPGEEAERFVIDQLAKVVAAQDQKPNAMDSSDDTPRMLLIELAGIYSRAGRHEDVLTLIEKGPWWGADDLAGIYTETDAHGQPLGYIVASALAAAGRQEEAKRILHALLEWNAGADRVYGLLVRLDAAEALKTFDEQVQRDPFQERPLIWKARVLLDRGEVDEAEKTIRRAISIDPSDGEQGKGTRMFAYAVLADVLDKQGKSDEAEMFRGAVKAIRLSEDADDFRSAGLDKLARQMYADSLKIFNDAYCVQSRLAIELFEAGQLDEAAKHYQRAFELMPDSFGMVESHCFGCEGVFGTPLAQSIAEEVFTRMLKEKPEQPQVHYLMGYLRSNQDRADEAVEHFQEAVRLAPDYLNAWKQIVSLAEQAGLTGETVDQAVLAQLRLDPLQRHTGANVEGVSDLKTLWNTVEQIGALQPKPVEKLMPLPAAAANEPPEDAETTVSAAYRYGLLTREGQLDPGDVVASTRAIQQIVPLLKGSEY